MKGLLIGLLLPLSLHVSAQSRLNFGHTSPQQGSLMPRSKGKIDQPKLLFTNKVSISKIGVLDQWLLTEDSVFLAQGTLLTEPVKEISAWYNAVVPGTVLTSLVKQGKYPDPYMGLNNMSIPESLARKHWWYHTSFEVDAKPEKKIWLEFDGINYKAEVWLNGKYIGAMNGAFVRGRFDISSVVHHAKPNQVYVKIHPPHNPGIPHEQSYKAGMGPNGGQLCLDGPTFISSEGWDWVPGIRDRNIGIWQPVRIVVEGLVSIQDPQIITDLPLPDTTKASITIKTKVMNHATVAKPTEVVAKFSYVDVKQSVILQPGETKEIIFDPTTYPALQWDKPALWWPNGYGAQALHHVTLQVLTDHDISDQQQVRFGIREYSYELAATFPDGKDNRFEYSPTNLKSSVPLLDNTKRKDVGDRIFIPSIRPGVPVGQLKKMENFQPFLVMKVNGIRVFSKGGNWGMDDGMKQVNREKLEPAFQLHKAAHFNMIRNWTGESTEEVFYELADEYGMMIWNDFWISTEGYNLNPNDQLLWLANSLETIRRFRNHPSIAIWCPRNEGYAPVGIEDELAMQLWKEDGTRHYIGNSREINLRQSGGWHYVENPSEYFTKYAEGFSTEIGTFSAPLAKTIRKFLKPEDWWPINDAWHYHDLHSNNQNLPGYLKAVDSLYGRPKDLDDFSRKVQLVNYDAHRAIFEAWNNKLWKNGSGVLLWMTHPAWPSFIWQTYSWDYETFGSFYGSQKANEPIHIQSNLHDGKIVVVNHSASSVNTNIIVEQIDIKGKIIHTTTLPVSVAANGSIHLDAVKLVESDQPFLLRLKLISGKHLLSQNDYWKTGSSGHFHAFESLATSTLKMVSVQKTRQGFAFEVRNTGKAPLVGLRFFTDRLPALFSEGYITLMPGEVRRVELQTDEMSVPVINAEAFNLLNQRL